MNVIRVASLLTGVLLSAAWLNIAVEAQGGAATAAQAPASAPAAAASPLQFSVDATKRQIRIDPIGVVIRLTQFVAVKELEKAGDRSVNLDMRGGQGIVTLRPLRLAVESCQQWDARLSNKRKQDPKRPFLDERWFPTFIGGVKGGVFGVSFCLDWKGGAVEVQTNVFDTDLKGPDGALLSEVATILADAFLPETAKPAPKMTSVEGVYPRKLRPYAESCKAGSANASLNCSVLEAWSSLQKTCANGNDAACVSIASAAVKEKDYDVAAVYYQRACELGDKKSCGRAEENKNKH